MRCRHYLALVSLCIFSTCLSEWETLFVLAFSLVKIGFITNPYCLIFPKICDQVYKFFIKKPKKCSFSITVTRLSLAMILRF